MKRSRFTQEQIIAVLKEHQAGAAVADLCRKHGISEATFYTWRSKYGGMEVAEAKRLKALEDENAKLRSCWRSRYWTYRRWRICWQKTADARLAARCRDLGDGAEGLFAAPGVRTCRHGAEDVPLCQSSAGRHGGAAAAAGVGGRAPAVRLPPPAHSAGTGGHPGEPQEAVPALPPGEARRGQARRPEAGAGNAFAYGHAGGAKPALVARLRVRCS